MFNLIPFATREPDLFDYFDVFDHSFHTPKVPEFTQFRADVFEQGNHYVLSAELPGFQKEEIAIDLKEDVLTITAAHKKEQSKNAEVENEKTDAENETKDDAKKAPAINYLRRERRECNFKRSFNVEGIDVANIKASYENGILELTLPKIAPKEPEHITISVA